MRLLHHESGARRVYGTMKVRARRVYGTMRDAQEGLWHNKGVGGA